MAAFKILEKPSRVLSSCVEFALYRSLQPETVALHPLT